MRPHPFRNCEQGLVHQIIVSVPTGGKPVKEMLPKLSFDIRQLGLPPGLLHVTPPILPNGSIVQLTHASNIRVR